LRAAGKADLSLIQAPAMPGIARMGMPDESPSWIQASTRTHPDLQAKIDGATETLWGYTARRSARSRHAPSPGKSLAAAMTDNGEGVAGNRLRRPLAQRQSLDDLANGSAGSVADGIIWATDRNARVINLSLDGTRDLRAVVDRGLDRHRRRVLARCH